MDNNFNSVFLGENGLTTTSAQHIKDMAGHYVDDLKQKLQSVTFINTNINIIGSDKQSMVNKGWNDDDLNSVNEILERISQAQALQAWLGEAINARQTAQNNLSMFSVGNYCELHNIDMPKKPDMTHMLTESEWLQTLPIKELNRYFTLQTYCAVFGNFVHPNRTTNFHSARQEAMHASKAPYDVVEKGRDTVIYDKALSLDLETIDQKYFELQAILRDKQSEFNALRHQYEVCRDEKFTNDRIEYDKQLQEYSQKMDELTSQWESEKQQRTQELAALKIVIPDALKSIFDIVNRLGK